MPSWVRRVTFTKAVFHPPGGYFWTTAMLNFGHRHSPVCGKKTSMPQTRSAGYFSLLLRWNCKKATEAHFSEVRCPIRGVRKSHQKGVYASQIWLLGLLLACLSARSAGQPLPTQAPQRVATPSAKALGPTGGGGNLEGGYVGRENLVFQKGVQVFPVQFSLNPCPQREGGAACA